MIHTLTNGRVEEFIQRLHLEKTDSLEGSRSRNENGWGIGDLTKIEVQPDVECSSE